MKKLALSLVFAIGLVASSFAAGNGNSQPASDVWQNMHNAWQGTQSQGNIVKQPQGGYFEEELKRKLNLTDDQINQIREIKRQEVEEIRNFLARGHKNALEEAIKNGEFDEDTFIRVSTENAKKVAEIRAKYLKKAFSILNEDQKRKFVEELKNGDLQKMMMMIR
jgi:Spy/CpxP family protein refolding chaperone